MSGQFGAAGGIKSIQRGIVTVGFPNTQNVTCAAVDMSKAFLTLSSCGGGTAGYDSVRARLTSGTNIELYPAQASGATANAAWELVEYQ